MFIIRRFLNWIRRRKEKKIVVNKHDDKIKETKKEKPNNYNIVYTSFEDEFIKNIIIRKLTSRESEYINKKYKEFEIKKINKSNYKNYCFGNRKYKNKVFSIISLYRITKGKRSDFKYIIIAMHTKNNETDAKLKFIYNLYIDFNNMQYNDNYYKLFKNKDFIEKIWKKVEKLYDSDLYLKRNKKGVK